MNNDITKQENRDKPVFTIESDLLLTEMIWGHRLHPQPLSALLLEFLGMAEAMHRNDTLFQLTLPKENCEYQAYLSSDLRTLIFNNPRMEQILADHGSGDEAWELWLESMEQQAKAARHHKDFSYLRDVFENDFESLTKIVKLIQRITFDPESSRKWTNKFLFPIGPAALYEAAGEKFDRDRTMFTRTGEIAYLMLSRADELLRNELASHFSDLFKTNTQKNKLILSLIEGGEPTLASKKGETYLPYKKHPAFDRLAEDVLALLRLGLPGNDVYEPLKYIIAFNLYLYGLETTQHWLGKNSLPPISCEIIGPRMDNARRNSIATKIENEEAAKIAVEAYLERLIEGDLKISELLQNPDESEEVKVRYLSTFLQNEINYKAPEGSDTVSALKAGAINIAKRSCEKNVVKALVRLGSTSGLVTKQGTNRLRYAPSDKLIEALILTNVTDQIEEKHLFATFQERYNLIISHTQAEHELPAGNYEAASFKNNAKRFTSRLSALGFATQLSDACTYVRNPYIQP